MRSGIALVNYTICHHPLHDLGICQYSFSYSAKMPESHEGRREQELTFSSLTGMKSTCGERARSCAAHEYGRYLAPEHLEGKQ
jgi:hypothetical protein